MSEAQDKANLSGTDQRRSQRYDVNQPATLSVPGVHAVSCEIIDYCVGGMFLRFVHPDIAIGALARRENAMAEISFSLVDDENAPRYTMPAQLRRLTPLGVGVAFSSPPVAALLALQKQRLTAERLKVPKSAGNGSAPQLRNVAKLLLRDTLEHALDLTEAGLPDKLNNASIMSGSLIEHGALMRAPGLMASQRKSIRQRMIDTLMRHLEFPDADSIAELPTNMELALVDENQFEDWLATASEVARLDETFRVQLAELHPRVAQAFDHHYEPSTTPFGPNAICHAYREALEGVELSPRARQIAYTALRTALADTLGVLYAELVALLPPALRMESAGSATSPYGPGTPRAAESGSALSQRERGTLGRLTDSLFNFFRGEQSAFAPPQAGADIASPDVLASPVLSRLDAAGHLPGLSDPVAARSVQLFGTLFDTMHAEKSVDEGVRPFFKQLEATLMKLAMADPGFLSAPTHPAHKVLNTIERLGMVAGEDGRIIDERLLRLMNRWTDRINAEASTNPGVFEEARAQLERVIKPLMAQRGARVARLQEMCESRQRVEEIRREVVSELFERYGEMPCPVLAIELLNDGWRNLLTMGEMRGAASEYWQLLDELVDWLRPDCAAPPDVEAAQTRLRRVDELLTRVCADKSAQDRLIDQLAAALLERTPDDLQLTSLGTHIATPTLPEPLSEEQLRMASRLRVGDWLEFDGHPAPLNLVWFGDEPPVYVFANYRGVKKLDLKRASLLNALEEGTARWADDMELPLMDRSYGAMIRKMQRDLAWQTSHDPATGLSTGETFLRNLRRNWLRRDQDSGYLLAAIRYGLADETATFTPEQNGAVVRALADALRSALPADALLSRLDGDTLGWWQAAESADSAFAKAGALQMFLADKLRPALPPQPQLHIGIGVVWRTDCLRVEEDFHSASQLGEIAVRTNTRVERETALEDAQRDDTLAYWRRTLDEVLDEDRLSLICHPVVPCNNPSVAPVYYEVVLHIPPTDENLIPTAELVGMAERLRRGHELDRRVLRHLFDWMLANPEQLDGIGGFACKVSAQSLADPAFLNEIIVELARSGIPANKLIFAITESAAVEEHANTHHFMRQLKRFGCRFMLDHFGMGASSFMYLKSLQLDFLKLDRLLLRDLETSQTDEALVSSIVETARFLNIRTVAGFVESLMLAHRLDGLGVDLVQGYAIAEPRLLEELNGN